MAQARSNKTRIPLTGGEGAGWGYAGRKGESL